MIDWRQRSIPVDPLHGPVIPPAPLTASFQAPRRVLVLTPGAARRMRMSGGSGPVLRHILQLSPRLLSSIAPHGATARMSYGPARRALVWRKGRASFLARSDIGEWNDRSNLANCQDFSSNTDSLFTYLKPKLFLY